MSHELLTKRQARGIALRNQFDAQLINGGAVTDAMGAIWPTESQESDMRTAMEADLARRAYAEFREQTPEGQRITELFHGLLVVARMVSNKTSRAAQEDWGFAEERAEMQSENNQAEAFLRQHPELGIGPDQETFGNPQLTHRRVNNMAIRVMRLYRPVFERPAYRFGREIALIDKLGSHRGWVLDDFTVDANIRLVHRDGRMHDVDALEQWEGERFAAVGA